FLGRLGDQVKVNGVRIELAEVEAGLMRVPGVDRALAAVKPDDNGRQRLVAYLPTSYPGTLSDVRAALKNRLPSAMLPSALVRLDHFPLTETGKLDRRALPAPGFRAVAVDRVQPHHAPDRAIAAIFAQVLQMPGFGLDDDFFDTGGDSLLLIEACLRIEELFGRTVPSGLVVQAPTPRLLAEMLRLQHTLDSFEHLVPITPGPVEDPIFWACDVHGQAVSMIAIARHLGRQALGLVPGDAVAMSSQPIDLWQLCERYAEEVIRAKPHGAYVICGYSFGGPWAFGVAVCLERMGREVTLALVDPVNNLSPGISLRRIVRGISIFVAKLAGAERGGLIQRVRLNSLRRLADPMQLTGTVPDFVPESALSLAQRLLAATGAFRSGTFGGPSVVLLSAKRNGSERAMNDDGLYGWRALLAGPITAVTCKASHEEMAQEAAAATARQLAHALQRAAVGAGDSAGDAGGVAKSSARRPRDLAYERLPISQGW
ncbi:MAG: phosphopantetheine-binding protein, partial [Sphingomonas sp.]